MLDAVGHMFEKKLQFLVVFEVYFAVPVGWPIVVFFGFEFAKAVKASGFEVATGFVATVVLFHPVDRELGRGYFQASQLSVMLFWLKAVSENHVKVDTPLHLERVFWEVSEHLCPIGRFESTHDTNIVLVDCTLFLEISVFPHRQ